MDGPTRFRHVALALCLGSIVLAGTGCPLAGGLKANVVTVLAWDLTPSKADVPNDQIQHLFVTITKITMVPADGGEGDKAEGHVTVFDAAESAPIEDVDLKDLSGVAELISTAEVPAGVYNQIRLSIEEPLMVLDETKAEYTNIHLTANSRLFITGEFEIPAGEVVVALDFDGVKIVETGNGDYTWTPQLRAFVDVTLVETTSKGTIEPGSLNTDVDTFTLVLTEGSVFVDYSDAEIYLDATPTDDLSLAEGQVVEVVGVLDGGVLTASSVRIVP